MILQLAKNTVFFFLFYVSFTTVAYAQNANNADYLLQNLKQKLDKVKDYTVDANIKLDVPFIKMLPVNAKIYFKQKNKFKVESKSIAVLPRQHFNQITSLLENANKNTYTALVSGNENIGTTPTTVVNIIPSSDTSDLVLAKFWVDPKQNVVLKSQLTSRSNGTILTEYTYNSQLLYGLPDNMVFTIDMKKFKLPKGIATDLHTTKPKTQTPEKERKNGKIYIKLANYQLNKGISDTIFKK